MAPVKKSLPVYDICSLGNAEVPQTDVIAERFVTYLKRHPNLYKAHGHSFYHLVLFTKGGGYHTIDFEQFPVQAGSIYFMVPGQVHSWAFKGDTDGYVVNFSEALFHSFFANNRYLEQFSFLDGSVPDNIVRLSKEVQAEAVQIMERIIAETHTLQAFQTDALRLLLLSLFILVARNSGTRQGIQDSAKPGQLLLQHFRRLVQQHYKSHRLPKDYAAMLYVTPNYLNALCRDLLGKPAGTVIRERILLEARRQLVNADAGIADIGYDLGFTDNSYFTKFFKKYTGMTPENFRQGLNPST